jgi:hypothetical protein
MKKTTIVIGIALGIGAVLAVIYFSMQITYQNRNERMKERIIAQQRSNEANFDKMFKSVAQVAEVAEHKMEKSKEAFKEIYVPLMEGRYSDDPDGMLMKWITESNPQFDLSAAGSLYDKLANAIESNRQEFFIEQQKLIDYNREQHVLVNTWPGYWFIESSDTIAIKIITSAKTKEVFAKGEENDIELFDEKE